MLLSHQFEIIKVSTRINLQQLRAKLNTRNNDGTLMHEAAADGSNMLPELTGYTHTCENIFIFTYLCMCVHLYMCICK